MTTSRFSTLIDAVDKGALSVEIQTGQLLAEKGNSKQLYLYNCDHESAVLRELGRVREESFRAVGLGSGKSCDLDQYDFIYDHLILWDDEKQAIIGSYRLMECAKAMKLTTTGSKPPLYTQSIYQYSELFKQRYFDKTVEIGRVFVHKSYWGTRSLDYLWYGMAYYFAARPTQQYFVCALSIPTIFSPYAKQLMVDFYSARFPSKEKLATSFHPYKDVIDTGNFFHKLTKVIGDKARLKYLKTYLQSMGFKFPMLYKNTEIFHPDGVQFISFGHDKSFNNALDGLMFADTSRIRSLTRKRYTSDVDKTMMRPQKQPEMTS